MNATKTKVVTTSSIIELESLELQPDTNYKVTAVIAGNYWGGGHGWQEFVNDIYKLNGRRGCEDFEDIVHSLHLGNGGDFESFDFVEINISWQESYTHLTTGFIVETMEIELRFQDDDLPNGLALFFRNPEKDFFFD